MKKDQFDEKVVEFAQSSINAKTFRHDYPLSSRLKEIIVGDVFRDYMKYAYYRYYKEYKPLIREFSESHIIQDEKRKELEENVFWWRLLFDAKLNLRKNSIEEYIAENITWLSKMPLAISWLHECIKSIPKFYHIGHIYDDRIIIVTDIFEKKPRNVVIYDPLAHVPIKDEIVAGTLLPLGGGLFFPIIDFYHFHYEARYEILRHLHHYHNKYSNHFTPHELFIFILSALLQVEGSFLHDQNHSVS